MTFDCEFCNKAFKTKGNLAKHISTSIKCIQNRNIEIVYLYCNEEGCSYKTVTQQSLTNHKSKCEFVIKSLQTENANLKTQNEMLENMLNKERERASVVNNITKTTTNNKQIVSNTLSIETRDNIFKEVMSPASELFEKIPHYIRENFTKQHLLGDKQAIYEFITNMVNEKLYYACTDKGGSNFLYKATDGSIKTDVQARVLIDRIYDPLVQSVEKIANQEIQRLLENSAYTEDEDLTKINSKSIKDIRVKTKTVKNIKNQDKDLRKNLADKLYYSTKYLSNYTDEPKKLLKETPKFQDIFYIHDYLNPEILDRVYSELTENELDDIYSSIKDIVQFIIENFLISNCKLVYNYDRVNNMFYYYVPRNTDKMSKEEISKTDKFVKLEEDKCFLLHKIFNNKTEYITSSPSYYLNIQPDVIFQLKNIEVFTSYMKKYLNRYQAVFLKV
jgi:hypothetical protein